MSPYQTRQAAHSPEAEAAVVSALLIDSRKIDLVADILPSGEAFYSDANRRIFDAMLEVHSTGTVVDVTTVANALNSRGRLHAIGGVTYLISIVDATPAVAHVESHARIVAEKWQVRQLADFCTRMTAKCESDYGKFADLLDEAEQGIYAIANGKSKVQSILFSDLVRAEVERLDRIRAGEQQERGVPFGFVGLDELTGGMQPGEVTVLAARPGMGKTALAVNIAISAAVSMHGGSLNGVLFSSLEMKAAALTRRAIASQSRVAIKTLARRQNTDEQWDQYIATVNKLDALPIWVDERARQTPTQLRAEIRRRQAAFNSVAGNVGPSGKHQTLSLVVVDYLQRMGSDTKRKDRFTEVAENMNAISDTAKDLGVHILLLAQVNRENTRRDGASKRPRMSDLAESGEIEKAANTIVFIHRPEYYVQDKSQVPDNVAGLAELIVDKQREGRTGIVMTRFDGEHTSFNDPYEHDIERWASGEKACAPKGRRR